MMGRPKGLFGILAKTTSFGDRKNPDGTTFRDTVFPEEARKRKQDALNKKQAGAAAASNTKSRRARLSEETQQTPGAPTGRTGLKVGLRRPPTRSGIGIQ